MVLTGIAKEIRALESQRVAAASSFTKHMNAFEAGTSEPEGLSRQGDLYKSLLNQFDEPIETAERRLKSLKPFRLDRKVLAACVSQLGEVLGCV